MIVSRNSPCSGAPRADEQHFRSPEVREREPPEGELLAEARERAGRSIRSNSPGARTFWWLPVTKSTTDTRRGSPLRGQSVQTPSSAAVSEIIGPAGSDMQMFPPTVASFQILNEARKDRQHAEQRGRRPVGRRLFDEPIEFHDLAGGGDLQAVLRGLE